MNAPEPSDAATCPACGAPNTCGAAAGAGRCWCEDAATPTDALAIDARAACLCPSCFTGETRSPCRSECVLDRRTGSCATCARTLAEIERWPRLDASGRRLVYRRLAARGVPRRESDRA